jgi:hypothetical protein
MAERVERFELRLRSPFARAVVPVLGGLALIAVIAALTWGIAAFISRGDATGSQRLAPDTFRLGRAEGVAEEIVENGPLLIPGLNTTVGERTIVVNHVGDDPTRGWEVYYAFPADRPSTCVVTQEIGTATFVDCEGRRLDVTELAPPDERVRPIVENHRTLVIDLRGVTTPTTTAGPA